jgi:hypothetical protein
MGKPRSSSSKRDREFRKREREQMKREKTALRRQRRENNKNAPKPLAPDVVPVTDTDAHRPDDQIIRFSPPEDSESESDADVGTESCAG